jgi:prepilin-type processing-associated H-X9-DG protein
MAQPEGGRAATNGIFIRDFRPGDNNLVKSKHVTDGTSNTVMIAEAGFGPPDVDKNMRPWMVGSVGEWVYNVRNFTFPINRARRSVAPENPDRSDVSVGSDHTNGTHMGFADGSVRFINDTVEIRMLYALGSRGADDLVPSEASN